MRYPGEVYFLPRGAAEGGDTKPRRHVLLANCEDGADLAGFAYASTQLTEAAWGAPNALVNPAATKYRRTGFSRPTYVYPSRIVSVDPECLEEPEGKVIDELPLIRTALSEALGLGTGTSNGRGPAAGSWRGRIVRLKPTIAEEVGGMLAVIVSDPEYSKAERYQNVVPILSFDEYEALDSDVEIADTSLLEKVDKSLHRAFLWTRAVFAVFQPTEVEVSSLVTIDEATIAELDESLRLHFEL
jgi:hypothetical protein